jgi:tRNA threonylcarbamoyladenosine biosynthesis protein TsaB
MLVLGIDTSGKSGGVTLAEGDNQSFRVLETDGIAGGTFSAQLVPTLAKLLQKHGFAGKDLGGFAVASGPGSFTGLRVGLSAVKGLAEVLDKPIATVSILQAVADELFGMAGSANNPVCRVVIDASRGEVFLGEYECLHPIAPLHPFAPKMLSESLLSLSELADLVNQLGYSGQFVTPDAQIIEALRPIVSDPFRSYFALVSRPTSENITRVGLRKLHASETVSVEALDANYIRRSDAELFFKGGR